MTVAPNPSVTERKFFFGALCFLCLLGEMTVPPMGEEGGGGQGLALIFIPAGLQLVSFIPARGGGAPP